MTNWKSINLLNTSDVEINPATSDNQTNGTQITRLKTYIESTLSTTTPLTANSTWTSDWYDLDANNITSFTFTMRSDKAGTMYLERSANASTVGDSVAYPYTGTNLGERNGESSSARYIRLRYVNGPADQTNFTVNCRLSTGPMGFSFRSGLQQRSSRTASLETSVNGLGDDFGFIGQFTPIRDLKVASSYRLIGTNFGTVNDANFWTLSNSGTASAASVANSIATMTSGTANNGYGQIQSVRTARFIFANPNLCRGLVRIPDTTELNNERRWGAFTTTATTTPDNGFYFSVDGAGVLSVNRVSAGSITTVTSGSFNGRVLSYTMDSNVHAYEIMYFMMGAWFYIDDVLIHKFTPTTAVLCQNWALPITATSINSATGTESADIELWASSIIRIGEAQTAPTSYQQTGTTAGVVLKNRNGILHALEVSNVSNNAVITVYDNTAASGRIIYTTGTMAANTTPFDVPLTKVPFFIGLTLVISGASANVTVIYE